MIFQGGAKIININHLRPKNLIIFRVNDDIFFRIIV